MHPCLCIPEILTAIFEEVNRHDLEKISGTRRDLHGLVSTCKTFLGPAITILWRTLSNPVPLLLTMPVDLWELQVTQDVLAACPFPQHKLLTFKRDVVQEDWQIFDFYAQFVRELGTTTTWKKSPIPFITIDKRIFRELERRNCILLPNLRAAESSPSQYSTLFLAPPTEHLTLHLHPKNITDIRRLIKEIPFRSPDLKSLYLPQSFKWQEMTAFILDAAFPRLLNGLQNLENFLCDWVHLSDESTIALLRMPNLRRMSVFKEIADLDRILLDHKVENPHLEEVVIRTVNLGVDSLAGLLTSLQPALLTSFHVSTLIGSCFQADLDSFLDAIGNHCSPNRFTELVLASRGVEIPTSVTTVNFATLEPLLSFSHLRVLTLSHHPFDMTDDEIKELAMAWPNLTELRYAVATTLKPRTTMRGLVWLAIFCRKLECLTFNFNDTVCEVSTDELALAVNHGLTFLHVGRSETGEIVEAFLKVVFPKLKRVMH